MDKITATVVFQKVLVDLTMEDGTVKEYSLHELGAEPRDDFLSDMGGRMVHDVHGKPTNQIKRYKDIQSYLISKTLYDENGDLVTLEVLRKFPASVLSMLFKASKKLSGLDELGEKEAKND